MTYTSREISIGNLLLGGSQPIRLQSMTSTPTMDTNATVEQAIRMIEAGSEMVRITAPGPREAAQLEVIKKGLSRRGYAVPIIADIHYSPAAAEIAAQIVEKVRINPGNYTDRTNFGKIEWTEAQYQSDLDKIAEKLEPLLKICKANGTAVRIGVNHGSLSRRIVSRYGDTPEGMVQSALEFTRICSAQGFHNLVLSIKSSNVRVMVEAYRMLAAKLSEEGLNYPLHLGVTEAGDGEDARLKSVAGIGAMLARGIGDTIRVSLTEAPEHELPVAKSIVDRFQLIGPDGTCDRSIRTDLQVDEEVSATRSTKSSGMIGGRNPVALIIKKQGNYLLADETGKWEPLGHKIMELHQKITNKDYPALLLVDEKQLQNNLAEILETLSLHPDLPVLAKSGAKMLRKLTRALAEKGLSNPIILQSAELCHTLDELLIENSLNPGNLLIDGIGDGLCLDAGDLEMADCIRIGFGVLQATRMRISRTEFIACPSCGRTQYDIQATLKEVKARTSHLKGLKIAVMGCIVNGPGEMADADYGYVGAGNGKVTLYKGRTPVRRSIPEATAVDALVNLIKENGDWR